MPTKRNILKHQRSGKTLEEAKKLFCIKRVIRKVYKKILEEEDYGNVFPILGVAKKVPPKFMKELSRRMANDVKWCSLKD